MYMADDNGKQPERASDDWAARRLSSKINEIGVTTPQFFDVVACAHSHPKNSGSRVTQLKIADASKPQRKLVPVCICFSYGDDDGEILQWCQGTVMKISKEAQTFVIVQIK